MMAIKRSMVSLAAAVALAVLLCFSALAAGKQTEVTVGTGGQYKDMRAVFEDLSLSGDVTVRLMSNVTDNVASGRDEEILVVPVRFASLTVAPGDGFTGENPVVWVVKNQNSIDKYAALYLNGRDFTLEKGVRLGDIYDTNIFGGGYQGTVEGSPTITIRGEVEECVYGGGYNSNLMGNPTIVVEGKVWSVFGGGLGMAHGTGNTDDESALVKGDVAIEVRAGAQVTRVRGGGWAVARPGDGQTFTSMAVSNVEGNISISVDGQADSVVGGGYVNQYYNDHFDVTANVMGNIEITFGGDSRSIGNGSYGIEAYGGGYAYDLAAAAEKAQSHRSTANVEGTITITAVEDSNAAAGQPDYRTFKPLMGGGFARGVGTTADVVGDTYVTTARVSFGDTYPIAGGGHANYGGHAAVTGTAHVTVRSIEGQRSSYENGNMVFGGGFADNGSGELMSVADVGAAVVKIEKGAFLQTGGFKSIVGGGFARGGSGGNANRRANILGDVLIQVEGAAGVKDIVVGGGLVSVAGTASVGGKVEIELRDTQLVRSLYPGCYVTGGDESAASPVKSSLITLLGETALLSVWKSSGGITAGLEIQVGDGVTETDVRVSNCLYEDKISKVLVQENAVLRHVTTGGNDLFYNLQDLEVAEGGRLEILKQKSSINGKLSGGGTIAYPAGMALQINGSMAGNLTLETSSGAPAAGETILWTKRANTTGTVAYRNTMGTKLAVADTNAETAEWCCWKLVDAHAISAAVDGGHGTVTPEEQLAGHGLSAAVTLTPEYGYKLRRLLRGSLDVTADVTLPTDASRTVSYVFAAQSDETLTASFELLEKEDMEERMEKLPEPDLVTSEHFETILDAKLDLEAMPEEEREQVDVTRLNDGLAALPQVEVKIEVTAEGAADVENKNILLSEMTGEEAKDLREGKTAVYRLGVKVAPKEDLSPEEQEALEGALGALKAGGWFDVTVTKVIEPAQGEVRTLPLTSLKNPLRLVFEVPWEQQAPNRRFSMLRIHQGSAERLEDLDLNPGTVTVESGLFSAYVLIYEEAGESGGTVFLLSAEAGQGGSITPSGTVSVPLGSDRTFLITPQSGWVIEDVLVDGRSVGPVERYTFHNVRAAHTIQALFAEDTGRRPPWNPFEDVDGEDWFYGSVKEMYEQGLMLGTSQTLFQPGRSISRAMMATVLWRMSGEPEAEGDAGFADVPEDTWYSAAVAWGAENSVVQGYSDGCFYPEREITRQELAAMLYRLGGGGPGNSPEGGSGVSSYSDAGDISDWALEAVNWAVESGILTGRGNGTLDPLGLATRAEAAAMLVRYLKIN